MHWLNGDGTILWANQTELNVLGYTAEEYIGQPLMNFCPDEKELVLEIFKQLGSGNAIADVPVRFRTKEEKIVHLLIDSNVAYNKDGSFGHTRCFIRDDTARKIRDARVQLLLDENERVSCTRIMVHACLFAVVPFRLLILIPPSLCISYHRV
jgi:two-component system sensor histidine kinase VicK